MNGRRNTATGQAGLWQSEGGGLVAVPDLEGGGQRGRAARGTEDEGDRRVGRKDAMGARLGSTTMGSTPAGGDGQADGRI